MSVDEKVDPEEVAQVLQGVKPVCANCKWWDILSPSVFAERLCRRYPVHQGAHQTMDKSVVRTDGIEWCGEFKVRPAGWGAQIRSE